MNPIYLAHVAAFGLAAVACLGSLWRVRDVEHPGTRTGLAALVATNGVWAGANLGYLVVPTVPAKEALYTLGLVAGLAAVAAWLYFCAAYTGRAPGRLPFARAVLGGLGVLVLLKVTNPIHGWYFTTEWSTTPFPHLAVSHGVVHWIALGVAYSLSFVGFFMLVERFQHAGIDTRPIAALVGLTALPVGVNVLAVVSPRVLAVTYEPVGVAVFAMGVLFVYYDRFQEVRFAGGTDDPVVFLDQNDRIREVNREAESRFPSLAGAIGSPVVSALPALDVADGSHEFAERFAHSHDGETRYYRVGSNPVMAGRTRTGRTLVLSDVTESERYRLRLQEKSEQLEALNRVVSHDIRNDMAVIVGWAESLDTPGDPDADRALERIRHAAEHTIELTEVAGDFVESLSAERDPDLEPIHLQTHLTGEFDAVRESYPDVQFDLPERLPSITVRANEMLSSVFRNLLHNAVQHNDAETPEVAVTVEERSDSVVVRVADNGPGVPDGRTDEIFGKGAQGLDSEGTGLGLYLVRTLVEQFDGSVHVEDNDPRGAVFVVELPTVDVAEESDDGPPAVTEAGSATDEANGPPSPVPEDASAEPPPPVPEDEPDEPPAPKPQDESSTDEPADTAAEGGPDSDPEGERSPRNG